LQYVAIVQAVRIKRSESTLFSRKDAKKTSEKEKRDYFSFRVFGVFRGLKSLNILMGMSVYCSPDVMMRVN